VNVCSVASRCAHDFGCDGEKRRRDSYPGWNLWGDAVPPIIISPSLRPSKDRNANLGKNLGAPRAKSRIVAAFLTHCPGCRRETHELYVLCTKQDLLQIGKKWDGNLSYLLIKYVGTP
jgi:hypothetical protein